MGIIRSALLAAVLIVPAQRPAASPEASHPDFEVLSIKPDTKGPSMSLYCHGSDSRPTRAAPAGHCAVVFAPLIRIIAFAYDIPFTLDIDQVISGGPAWMDTERYDIDLKANHSASEVELKNMLQTVLAERFQLSFHKKTKEVSAYGLVVGRGGPRVVPVTGNETPAFEIETKGQIVARHATMGQLADQLKAVVGVPVTDQTELLGFYNFTLKWNPDMDPASALVIALQDQLGLRLQSIRGPADFLYIDHVEKPKPV